VGPEGNGTCDCDEGWLRHEGRCYQEFSPAFCGEGKILNLGTRRRLKTGQQYTCVSNPCEESSLPFSSTWEDRFCHPRPDVDDIASCELYVSNKDVDGSILKCCEPSERRECSDEVLINPASLAAGCKHPGCCRRGTIFSPIGKKCVEAFRT